ncbi:MAG TPA: type II secretion system F family protein [Opitutaceae bacterium]|jgi:type IV pilus assembly protein PilC|nr:type II secretion system F family protein [Opitutaceae bacterium]
MPFITSAQSGQSSSRRPETQQSNKSNLKATQTLARQKALERKAKNYKLPLGELAIFTQQLASLLTAGLPLVQSLEALQDQTEDQVFCVVIREVRQEISAGNSFSSSVKKFPKSFPALFISMVEAGEASGALSEILSKVATYFEASVKLMKKVKSAMTYPIVVISLAVVLVNVMLIFVVPVFADMFKEAGKALPVPTQMLIDMSHFLGSWRGAVLGVVLFGIGYALNLYCQTPVGRRQKDLLLVRAPIFGSLIRKIALSRFCRTYATLMRSGVPILRTLEIVSSASNKVQIEDACVEIAKHVSQGGQVSEVLATNPFFPPMMKHMVKAGETTGNVDGMMNKVADFYDTECDAIVGALTSLIEPFLIVILGVIVGGIVIAMFLPIFNLANVAGGQ